MPVIGIQQECRHRLVHLDAANALTKNITQDAHLKIVHKTRRSMNTNQHAIRHEYIHIILHTGQLGV